MKRIMMILTLLVAVAGSANATWVFRDVTAPTMRGGDVQAVAWGDVDNDGSPELFVGANREGRSRLLFRVGNQWIDRAREYGVSNLSSVRTARLLDYDHDGLMDIFCLTNDESGAALYRQLDAHRFQQVSLGLDPLDSGEIRGATWSDLDGNGAADLILSNRASGGDESVTLIQTEEGFAEDRGVESPFSGTDIAQVSPIDLNLDGQVDYLISKVRESGASTDLWMNYDGRMVNVGPRTQLPPGIAQHSVTWADFDHDEDLDLFCGSQSGSRSLFYQQSNGTFVDMTERARLVSDLQGTNDVQAVDANGDGWTDLFAARHGSGERGHGNVFLVNNEGRGWIQSQTSVGLENAGCSNYSTAWCDYDHDGDLDLAIPQGNLGVALYRNDLDAAPNEHVILKLCGTEDDSPQLNCLVSVNFPSGKQWAATSMYQTGSSSSDQALYVYNWTSTHSREYSVDVVWPNGEVTSVDQSEFVLNHVLCLHMPANTVENSLALPEITDVSLVNYPNPFNPSTTVSFVLPAAGDVSIAVYNLLGQQVAMLAKGAYESGPHSVVFDASSLPSGLYLARLDAPGQSAVHRMLLTK